MKTLVLDAKSIDPKMTAEEFLCQFYHLTPCSLSECKRKMYEMTDVLVTEVFNWPADFPAWKSIASALESVQQHSAYFYVIWGPETENAIAFEEQSEKIEQK